MTKEEMIRYLDAVFNAEEGHYEAQRLFIKLDNECKAIDHKVFETILPDLPDKPTPEPAFVDKRQQYLDSIQSYKQNIRQAYLNLNFKDVNRWKEGLALAEDRYKQAEIEYANRSQLERERVARFEAANEVWTEKNKKYQQSILLQGETVHREVLSEKQKQEARVAEFRKALDELYGMNILYKDFRNPDAVLRLKEYLEMGITSTLEGPDGAYRFYLDDLRAQKIVGSIEELRASVEIGFTYVLSGQKQLYDQLVVMEGSLQEIGRNMDSYFNQLNDRIIETGRSISKEIKDASQYEQEIMKQIQRTQEHISSIVEASAYNKYLVDRKDNIDNYLLYQLKNPMNL